MLNNRGRSTWRGRGSRHFGPRGRGGFSYGAEHQMLPKGPLAKLLESISLEDLQDHMRSEVDRDLRIRDCEFVASYNLLEKPANSIAVPGECDVIKGSENYSHSWN